MGIHEYQCEKCGNICEKLFINKDVKQYIECPDCKKRAKKIISSGTFVINGYSASNNYSKEK